MSKLSASLLEGSGDGVGFWDLLLELFRDGRDFPLPAFSDRDLPEEELWRRLLAGTTISVMDSSRTVRLL